VHGREHRPAWFAHFEGQNATLPETAGWTVRPLGHFTRFVIPGSQAKIPLRRLIKFHSNAVLKQTAFPICFLSRAEDGRRMIGCWWKPYADLRRRLMRSKPVMPMTAR